MGIFPNPQGQLTHKSLVGSCRISNIRDIIGLLVACKNEEDPMKNEGARMAITLFNNF